MFTVSTEDNLILTLHFNLRPIVVLTGKKIGIQSMPHFTQSSYIINLRKGSDVPNKQYDLIQKGDLFAFNINARSMSSKFTILN